MVRKGSPIDCGSTWDSESGHGGACDLSRAGMGASCLVSDWLYLVWK